MPEHENNEKDPSKVHSNKFAVNYMAMSPVIDSSITSAVRPEQAENPCSYTVL